MPEWVDDLLTHPLFTLLVGVAITLGVDRYREWRTELRESKERQQAEQREREARQRETAKEMQGALVVRHP